MSLISTQIKELRQKAENTTFPIYRKSLNDAANTIEELSAKLHTANMERSTAYYNGGWIPCSLRNPTKEECGEYGNREFQVTINNPKPKTITMVFVHETVRGKEVARWKWKDGISPWEVVAWKPLDEPYKEDDYA